MHSKQQSQNSLSRTISCAATAALAIAILFALTVTLAQPAQGQTYRVVYNFTGAADGGAPMTGLTMDQAGNFYGTTNSGGSGGAGTVFKLKHTNSGWAVTTLYNFTGGDDGGNPQASLTIGPDGSLYGTTSGGGSNCGGSALRQGLPSATVAHSGVRKLD